MQLTLDHLHKIVRSSTPAQERNMLAIIEGLHFAGESSGLQKPHRLAHFVAQITHESGDFRYDHELWGPTAAQLGYEGRHDLGNVSTGDGYKFRGRTAMQLTGRANYHRFYDWCVAKAFTPPAPVFTEVPDALTTDPWEGLVPIWFWESHDLNEYADANNIEMITHKINGGLNGFKERVALFTRTALVFLNFAPSAVIEFQRTTSSLKADGIAGPATRQALFNKLLAL